MTCLKKTQCRFIGCRCLNLLNQKFQSISKELSRSNRGNLRSKIRILFSYKKKTSLRDFPGYQSRVLILDKSNQLLAADIECPKKLKRHWLYTWLWPTVLMLKTRLINKVKLQEENHSLLANISNYFAKTPLKFFETQFKTNKVLTMFQ